MQTEEKAVAFDVLVAKDVTISNYEKTLQTYHRNFNAIRTALKLPEGVDINDITKGVTEMCDQLNTEAKTKE